MGLSIDELIDLDEKLFRDYEDRPKPELGAFCLTYTMYGYMKGEVIEVTEDDFAVSYMVGMDLNGVKLMAPLIMEQIPHQRFRPIDL